MHLKTLTLRGFKSFASSSTLRFEPGITCVVGPNGSGKSNVVDALSWVMGEQGVKSLRGGKMEDVVFAGTTSRPALGRAEVTLTIDNSDGALPIEYAEITLTRLLFRSGQSEYSLNGDHCRLLDIQELLSDSGLGREMHVIVGQGQLDEVLHAGPDARRALIEEAAGVLKHRKRKEKALRKLDAMQANLTRLVDLTTELGRRLKPLGRQAEIARKAAAIQADLRDARLRLLADDYVTLAAELERETAGEALVTARRAGLDTELSRARDREAELEDAAREHAPRLARAQETWFALSALAERFRGVAGLAAERHRHLSANPGPVGSGRDPDALDAEAAALREEEAALSRQLDVCRDRLDTAVQSRTAAESALADAERRLASQARDAAARAERLAKLRGQVEAARSRGLAAQEEISRLEAAQAQAAQRVTRAEQEHARAEDATAGREDGRAGLAAACDQAAAAVSRASERVTALRAAEHQASGDRAALRARKEALEEALTTGGDASKILLGEPGRFGGVLGSFAAMLTVEDGAQLAIASALGAAADAVAVAGLDEAVTILGALRGEDAGGAGLVIAGSGDPRQEGDPGGDRGATAAGIDLDAGVVLPDGARAALDLVRAPAAAARAAAGLLGDVVVAADLSQARDLVRANPGLRVVTREGDLLGTHWAQGGSAKAPSLLETRAAADAAAAGLAAAEQRCEHAESELAGALADEERARQVLARAQAGLQGADSAAAESSGRVGLLAGAARAAREEAGRIGTAVASAQRARETALARFEDLERRLTKAEAEEDERAGVTGGGPGAAEADVSRLGPRCSVARAAEMEARLEVRTLEERVRAIAGRGDALASAAAAERQAREQAAARLARRTRDAAIARAVAEGAGRAIARIETSVELARAERQAAEEATAGQAEELARLRARITAIGAELDTLTDRAHSVELVAAEHRVRLQQIASRVAEEYGLDTHALLAEYGPDAGPAPAGPGEWAVAAEAEGRADRLGQPDESREANGVRGHDQAGGAIEARGVNGARAEDEARGPDGVPGSNDPGRAGGPAGINGSGGVNGADGQGALPVFNRAETERRARVAERQLAQLGKVNPLALEEFEALQERHAFLGAQLEDLKKTRRDLLTVVKEVDERVQQVFEAAYQDTAREFEGIFARLFPGGQGRLVLTEPDDMLSTGIEVEARPPGKKVKRLSLLSGGERSLTAIAYLLAIFKARPSPFYVLDEVEAALDDTNLQRLLGVFDELRETSQLIIVTHQKRTMEVADSLYGISMQGDGVSSVVSQRLRERERV
ncbi:MAG TPA: AAA family ATPase [Streptosporangiaceae bacterium]